MAVCQQRPSPPLLVFVPPVGSDVAHEQDAGIHVEVEGRSANGTVEQMEMGGGTGVVGNADWETQADEEVGGNQVLQVDGDTAGWKETPAEVDPQSKAVEDQTELQDGETGIITTIARTTTKTHFFVSNLEKSAFLFTPSRDTSTLFDCLLQQTGFWLASF